VWENQWDCCIHSHGDYFEGDGSQNWVSQHFFFWSSLGTFW
jgi:hypothetical protein